MRLGPCPSQLAFQARCLFHCCNSLTSTDLWNGPHLALTSQQRRPCRHDLILRSDSFGRIRRLRPHFGPSESTWSAYEKEALAAFILLWRVTRQMLFCDNPPQRFPGNTVNLVNGYDSYESGVLNAYRAESADEPEPCVYVILVFVSSTHANLRRGTKIIIH
jgi:hypothetical protein